MPKPFDAATKHLVEARPLDWLALAGLPADGPVRVVDADLSAVTSAADKLLQVAASGTRPAFLAHIEFQSSPDPHQDRRIAAYNALARWRHRLPVYSVVFLLRPQARSRGATGRSHDMAGGPDGTYGVDFRYRVVRVWEVPPDVFLAGGLGTLPLAPIGAVDLAGVANVVRRVDRRLTAELPPAEAQDFRTATLLLLGLRHSRQVVRQLMKGLGNMKGNSFCEILLDEGRAEGFKKGRAEGRAEAAREIVLRLGTRRFGPPDDQARAALAAVTDLRRLQRLTDRVLDAGGWDELLRPRAGGRANGRTTGRTGGHAKPRRGGMST